MSRLQERVYRSSTLSPSPSMPSVASRCPSYRNYDNDQLMRAYEAVKNGCSIRSAAEKFGVPRSTLSDHVSGKVQNRKCSGPEHYLSDEEEKELVCFICKAARIRYAKTRKEVMSIVEKVLSYKGKRVTFLVLTYPDCHTSFKATESKSARVLTSLENRMALVEKESQKKEKEELKERRKLKREQKKAEKQAATKQKKKNTKCVRDELDLDVLCHIFDFSGNRSEGSQLYSSDNEVVDVNTSIHSSITSEIGSISGSSTTKGGSSSRALSKRSPSSRIARRKNPYNSSCKPSCTSSGRVTRTTDTASACESSALNSKPGYTRGGKTTNSSNSSVLNKLGSTGGSKTTNEGNSSVISRCSSLSSLSDTDNVDDEKGYCFCNGKDEGQMVYCENKNCRNGQWFHFKCVKMKTAPRGLWFCSNACNEEFQCH